MKAPRLRFYLHVPSHRANALSQDQMLNRIMVDPTMRASLEDRNSNRSRPQRQPHGGESLMGTQS